MNIRTCQKSEDGKHNFAVPGAMCMNLCGITQHEISYGKKPESPRPISFAFAGLQNGHVDAREPTTKARTYTEELVLPYLPYIQWVNETYEDDRKFFWMSVNQYMRGHTHAQLVGILEWAKKKNCLFPRQVTKVLRQKPAIMHSAKPTQAVV